MATGLFRTGHANQVRHGLSKSSVHGRVAVGVETLLPKGASCVTSCWRVMAMAERVAAVQAWKYAGKGHPAGAHTHTQSIVPKRSVVQYSHAIVVHCETTTGGRIHSDAIASTGRQCSCTLIVVAIISLSVLDLYAGSCSATCVVFSRAKDCRECLGVSAKRAAAQAATRPVEDPSAQRKISKGTGGRRCAPSHVLPVLSWSLGDLDKSGDVST